MKRVYLFNNEALIYERVYVLEQFQNGNFPKVPNSIKKFLVVFGFFLGFQKFFRILGFAINESINLPTHYTSPFICLDELQMRMNLNLAQENCKTTIIIIAEFAG